VWAGLVVEGVAESTASLLKVFSGWLSDKVGRRKFLIFGGYGFSAASKLIFVFSTIWKHVLAGRLLDRVGKGIRTSPRDALIADSIGRERRGGYGQRGRKFSLPPELYKNRLFNKFSSHSRLLRQDGGKFINL